MDLLVRSELSGGSHVPIDLELAIKLLIHEPVGDFSQSSCNIRLHSCLGQVSLFASPKLASARICPCHIETGTLDRAPLPNLLSVGSYF